MMPKKLTLLSISSFTWGQIPRQQDNKTQTCHLGDNYIQLSVRNKDLRLFGALELGCIYAVAKKIMEFSLSKTIYLNAKFYNQPIQKLWISFCPEFSQYKFYKSTKHPKVMEFLSRTLSRYKFQPTQKAPIVVESSPEFFQYKFQPTQKPKDHGILSLSLSLSLCANCVNQ